MLGERAEVRVVLDLDVQARRAPSRRPRARRPAGRIEVEPDRLLRPSAGPGSPMPPPMTLARATPASRAPRRRARRRMSSSSAARRSTSRSAALGEDREGEVGDGDREVAVAEVEPSAAPADGRGRGARAGGRPRAPRTSSPRSTTRPRSCRSVTRLDRSIATAPWRWRGPRGSPPRVSQRLDDQAPVGVAKRLQSTCGHALHPSEANLSQNREGLCQESGRISGAKGGCLCGDLAELLPTRRSAAHERRANGAPGCAHSPQPTVEAARAASATTPPAIFRRRPSLSKRMIRQPSWRATPLQLGVRVDGDGVPDGAQHRQIGLRVRVRVRLRPVDALLPRHAAHLDPPCPRGR